MFIYTYNSGTPLYYNIKCFMKRLYFLSSTYQTYKKYLVDFNAVKTFLIKFIFVQFDIYIFIGRKTKSLSNATL